MFGKLEIGIAAVCLCLIVVAIYLAQSRSTLSPETQPAAVSASAVSVVDQATGRPETDEALTALRASTPTSTHNTMKITDIKTGTGAAAAAGDTVAVHYVGRLTDGTEFDNSHKRGAPIEFTLGAGQVIPGWEEGIAGMQVGGERTLVIPPEKAYGDAGIGPIPGGATLTFAVELVEIK